MPGPEPAIVVGSGPNGLSAAAVLARAGWKVRVVERAGEVGGGARTLPLTLPGFRHDLCSAIHPLAVASPLFRSLPLSKHGVRWVRSPAALAHPFDDGTAALLLPSPSDAGATLGPDARAWAALFRPLSAAADELLDDVLGLPFHLPRRPLLLARFGVLALRSASALLEARFRGPRARAVFAGIAAHAGRPLEAPGSAAFGLVLGVAAHGRGWPFPEGGAGRITEALASMVREAGGEVVTGSEVRSLAELGGASLAPGSGARGTNGAKRPEASVRPQPGEGRTPVILLDLVPRGVLRVAGDRLPRWYAGQLARYRHGPGAVKLDWALAGPIPWRAHECAQAATVHLGGSFEEIAEAERRAAAGELPGRPFVILAQHTLFDPTRAPPGRHTAWAYAHVPAGWAGDAGAVADAIEAQVERFAPGFRERVLHRTVHSPAALERENPNLVGGDVGGGENSLRQLLARPAPRLAPWTTPVPGLFLCSAATPPGGGVHGMCGAHAAEAALGWIDRSAPAR